MKNKVGTPATGADFFPRDREVSKILGSINVGNNLQIAAPRRVGKTSILHYLKNNQIGGHIYVLVDMEDVYTEQDFFKKLIKAILRVDEINKSAILNSLIEGGKKLFKKVKSVKVMGTGIDFNDDHEEADYFEEITNFLSSLELEGNRKLVLLIDEFPQAILNIIEQEKRATNNAIRFLQANRQLRQLPEILGRVQFVYTGSIGLNHTAAAINASAFINDLNTIEIEPLTPEEARTMVYQLMAEKSFSIDDQTVSVLLDKIKWLIPFHIQLAIHELSTQCIGKNKADTNDVAKAFAEMIAQRNYNHFDHYYGRLKTEFKGNEFEYAEVLLNWTAAHGSITNAKLHDLSVEYKIADKFRNIVGLLAYDGYINNNADKNAYEFNSPILRFWWQAYICN